LEEHDRPPIWGAAGNLIYETAVIVENADQKASAA
jgi:hypothetical protein